MDNVTESPAARLLRLSRERTPEQRMKELEDRIAFLEQERIDRMRWSDRDPYGNPISPEEADWRKHLPG